MRFRRFLPSAAFAVLASIPAFAGTPCSIDISIWGSSGQIKNPHNPVPLVSVDEFKPNGEYHYTIAGQGSAFGSINGGSQCVITNVSYALNSPLAAVGGAPTPSEPLYGVNVAFYDDRSERPLAQYPGAYEGSIVFTGTDTQTGAKFSATLSIVLTIVRRTE